MNYELHPLCTIFPRVDGGEYAALVEDIRVNGLRESITLHDGMILDGGNRYRACLDAGIKPHFREFAGDSIVAFVLSANLHRRHLSPGQQAAIVATAQDWAKAQVQGANRHTTKTGNLAGLETVADRAATSGAGERTQRMADKVAKASPDLAKQVAHGEISLPKAVEQITGKRPGAKPSKPEPEPELNGYNPDDQETRIRELSDEIAALEQENRRLSAIQNSLDADDAAQELIRLNEHVLALEGRLSQEIKSGNEARKQATHYGDMLRKIAAKLKVEKYSQILGALK